MTYETISSSFFGKNFRIVKIILVIFLSALVFFQLYPTLRSYFMADDFSWLRFVENQESIVSVIGQPSPGGWTTPLPNALFWVLFKTFGFSPTGYYIIIAALHLLISVLVFYLIYQMSFQNGLLALFSAFVFALHFIHFSDWGPLVWISAFVQLVVAFFYLCALILFIRYIQKQRIFYYVGAIICFVFALSSKETSASLPILLLSWCLISISSPRRYSMRGLAVLAPFFLVLGVYLLYEFSFQFSGQYLQKGLYGFGPHLLTNWKYFSNLVMPNPSSPPVHNYLLRTFPAWVLTLAQYGVWIIRGGLLLLFVILFWKGSTRVRLWIALAVVTYLPFIGFVEGFAGPNRYFYLPAVGFSALLAEGLLWTFGYLRARTTFRMATSIMIVGILLLWIYNLVPIRSWQKQMIANSEVRRHTLALVESRLVNEPISKVYLAGFPDKFGDLQAAIRAFYDLDAEWLGNFHEKSFPPSSDTVILEYDEGQIVIRHQ